MTALANNFRVELTADQILDLCRMFNLSTPAHTLVRNLEMRRLHRIGVKYRHNHQAAGMTRTSYGHIIHSPHYVKVERHLGLID